MPWFQSIKDKCTLKYIQQKFSEFRWIIRLTKNCNIFCSLKSVISVVITISYGISWISIQETDFKSFNSSPFLCTKFVKKQGNYSRGKLLGKLRKCVIWCDFKLFTTYTVLIGVYWGLQFFAMQNLWKIKDRKIASATILQKWTQNLSSSVN